MHGRLRLCWRLIRRLRLLLTRHEFAHRRSLILGFTLTVFENLLAFTARLLHPEIEDGAGNVRGCEPCVEKTLDGRLMRGIGPSFHGGLEFLEGLVHAIGLHLLLRWHFVTGDLDIDVTLDALHQIDFTSADETDGHALSSGTSGAANTVNIILLIVGEFKIDDEIDVVHIEATGCDVSRYQHFNVAAAEIPHHALTHHLIEIAMKTIRRIAPCHEGIHGVIHCTLGVGKDDRETRCLHVEKTTEHFDLGSTLHLIITLLHRRYGQRFVLDSNRRWILRVSAN